MPQQNRARDRLSPHTTAEALAEAGEQFDVVLKHGSCLNTVRPSPIDYLIACRTLQSPAGFHPLLDPETGTQKSFMMAIVGAEQCPCAGCPIAHNDCQSQFTPDELI